MPIFEYHCEACGQDFEDLVGVHTEDSEVSCPKCGEKKASRKLSAFATGGSASTGKTSAVPSSACSIGGG
jgi:putative FmdB family regulatory protein